MSDCLNSVVSLRSACDSEPIESLSGYDLMDAPELSEITLANIANEDYITGRHLADKSLKIAILEVRNDFLGVISSNNIVTNLSSITHPTSVMGSNTLLDTSTLERGITLYRNNRIKGSLRRLYISKISVHTKTAKDGAVIAIYDNGIKTSYTVNLIADKINVFNISYEVQGSYARVLIDNTGLQMYSTRLICQVGCNGTMPNDCGYTKGYNGNSDVPAKEGFGLGIDFHCECDYGQILCNLAKSYVGKLIYLKARLLLLDERLYTNRNNNWVVYGVEEAREIKQEVSNEYVQHWNTFVASLGNILLTYKDDCVKCNGIQWKTNI